MKPQGFFRNGGLAMLLGFACLLAAMGFGIAGEPGMRPVVILIVLGIIQLSGVVSVQLRRLQQLEHLLLGETPEARKFRRRLQLADSAAESVPPSPAPPLPPH
jgi:hypothetical protein